MIRLFMIATLFSASVHAADLSSTQTASKSCTHCNTGATGPQGPNGSNGPDGPTGPTGAAGLASPNIIMPFSACSSDILSPINPPLLGRVVSVPFGGAPAGIALASNGVGGPTFVQLPLQHVAYNTSQNLYIVNMAATFTLSDFIDIPSPGSEITARMEIWVAPFASNTFTPSGAGVNFPTLIVPENPMDLIITVQTVAPTPLNVLIPSGSRILMILSFTATENIRIIGIGTAGISMSYSAPP